MESIIAIEENPLGVHSNSAQQSMLPPHVCQPLCSEPLPRVQQPTHTSSLTSMIQLIIAVGARESAESQKQRMSEATHNVLLRRATGLVPLPFSFTSFCPPFLAFRKLLQEKWMIWACCMARPRSACGEIQRHSNLNVRKCAQGFTVARGGSLRMKRNL